MDRSKKFRSGMSTQMSGNRNLRCQRMAEHFILFLTGGPDWVEETSGFQHLDETGTGQSAINAGKQINSKFDEISPFIHANDKTLYFASNGLPGFGGYDIFYAERDSSIWDAPKNIGNLINDHEDQFSFFITADGKKGYYSHEETLPSGFSRSKIYEVEIPPENQVKFRSNYVKGIIRDKVSQSPLTARIELINIERERNGFAG